MATNTDQGGYDLNFTSEIPEELRCLICHLVLREPVQIMTCGHRFCGICFERMKDHAQQANMSLQCPADREVVNLGLVFPDKAANRTIGNLKVRCGNHHQGCPWIDDLRDLQNHEEICEFRIIAGMQEMLIANGRHVELNILIQQILSRLLSCENSLLEKDKKLSHLKATVGELREYHKLKDEEIQMLKVSNAHLKAESAHKNEEVKQLKESINMIRIDMASVKKSTDENTQDINKLQVKCVAMDKEIEEELKEQSKIRNWMSNMEEEAKTTKGQISQSIEALKDESTKHIENIENVLFAHKRLQETNEVSFLWVMTDYANNFGIGKPVLSPIFHTKVCGNSFQLMLYWSGENKEKLYLALLLHRDKTSHNAMEVFNTELTLACHGKEGKIKTRRWTHEHITMFKDASSKIKEGKAYAERCAGFHLLTAPYDGYVINDSLLTSCTLHL